MTQTVITAKQARQITGGRKPLVPVEYETAVNALQACVTIDDAKYWSDKADALAAWAKIYRNDDAGRKARQLRLHAYRRMGQLAGELRPDKRYSHNSKGFPPGPISLLTESGLTTTQASAARKLAKFSDEKFVAQLTKDSVPSPMRVLRQEAIGPITNAWGKFSGRYGRAGATQFLSFCRAHSAKELARGLAQDEAIAARHCVGEIQDWLDEFEQHLPKPKP